MQRDGYQHADAGVYACSPRHELCGAELWGVERMQLQRCLCADGNEDEDSDELRVQLREWTVRGLHEHRDAGVYCNPGCWLQDV